MRHALVILGLCLAAYYPSLSGEFLYDDVRFVEDNEAIRSLAPSSIASFFTDPATLAPVGWKGIYRPLRTLDFAIDWAISGGKPWFFHLRNVLYHALGSVLLMLVLMELFAQRGKSFATRAGFPGAVLFALHPVHTESVAWITSRGDVLVLVFLMLALLAHLRGKRVAAAIILVIALLSKESAVVFVGLAVVVDLYRGEKRRYGWYGVYTAIALCYVVLWNLIMPSPEFIQMPGHLSRWWGGSYGANLLTMSKGYLLYLHRLLFPVDLLIDYHVPALGGIDVGSAVSIAVLVALLAAAIRGGARSRLALAFFFIALFPVSNLMIKVGIPTAERFLYVPAVGVMILVSPWLARLKPRLVAVVFACFFLLTFHRCYDWRSMEALWGATNARAATPRGLSQLISKDLLAAHEAQKKLRSAPLGRKREQAAAVRRHAEAVIRRTDQLIGLYRDEIGMPPDLLGSRALSMKANALMLLGRPEEALEAADQALRISADKEQLAPSAWYNAALACQELGQYASAAKNLAKAKEVGYESGGDLTPAIATLWNRAAAEAEAIGNLPLAVGHYRRSWEALPDRTRNAVAAAGLARLRGRARISSQDRER